jgi:hypothetical protein
MAYSMAGGTPVGQPQLLPSLATEVSGSARTRPASNISTGGIAHQLFPNKFP